MASFNAVSVLIAGVFGALALVDPAARAGITGPVTDDIVVYASLYGIRSVLIAAAVLILLVIDRQRRGERLLPLLWLAGAIQVADTALLVAVQGDLAMAIGPAIAAATHLTSAVLIVRRATNRPANALVSSGHR